MGAVQGEGLLQGEQRRALCANHRAQSTLFQSDIKISFKDLINSVGAWSDHEF